MIDRIPVELSVKRLLVSALALGLAACSSGGTSSTTTSVAEPTSTMSSPSSTSATVAPTTTIVPVSTTTLLQGNWADQPVVTAQLGTLGWWDGAEWVDAQNGMSLPVNGGEDYQVAVLWAEGTTTTGGPRITVCDVYGPEVDLPGIELADPELLTIFDESDASGRGSISGVAVSAPWSIHPRPVTPGEWHPDLENLAFSLLGDRGFTTDSVNNVQSVDADLDGDGSLETLLVIEDTRLANSGSGVYSMVFVVTPSSGEVHVVAESVIPPSDEGYPVSHRISAIADLSGDGVMEVVVDSIAWESSQLAVHEFVEGEFVERIGAGCGV